MSMTRIKTKLPPPGRKRAAKAREVSDGTYVCCILESPDGQVMPESAPEGLENGHRLEFVSSAGLAAVVSAIPLSHYGEKAIEANLANAAWAATRAMRHERVVEFFASRGPLIPLRFGTIYLDRMSVERMLSSRALEFRSVMKSLRGRQEWGVLIYCDHAALVSNIVSKNADILLLMERAAAAPPGQSYLLAKQIEALKARTARQEISAAIVRMKEDLDASSDQSASGPLERRRTEHGELIARLSFLVRARRFGRFQATAERLARAYVSSGFHIELVGPMPPYSFVVQKNRSSALR